MGGGSSAEFLFSVTSKGNFPLMGPFWIFLLYRRGDPGAEFFFSVTSKRHFPLMGPFFSFLLSRRGGPGHRGPPLNRPLVCTNTRNTTVGWKDTSEEDMEPVLVRSCGVVSGGAKRCTQHKTCIVRQWNWKRKKQNCED